MSVHWHDDELEWCPCDEPEGVEVPTIWNDPDNDADAQQAGGAETKVVSMLVDYDRRADSWFGCCTEHGEIVHAGGTADDHNRVVIELAKHDEREHGGEGSMWWSYVYDDEESAREVLAAWEANPYRTDVGLWVRDVTPWRQA